jgi:fucose 4-O-acetylase-like acetyltransferase
MAERTIWVDTAKAMGIALVVIGHVLAASGPSYHPIVFSIFLFHMPLFFMLSGVLHRNRGVAQNARRRARALLVPYLAFILLIFVLDMVISKSLGLRPAVGSLSGAIHLLLGGSFATGKYGVLWFTTCLFIVGVLYDVASTQWKPLDGSMLALVAALLAASAAIGLLAPLPNPLGILDVPAAFVVYWFGRLIADNILGKPALAGFVVVALLVGLASTFAGWDMTFDMKSLKFGPPVAGLMLALALSLIFIAVCAQIRQPLLVKGVAFVSEQTLTIMMLHQFTHFTLQEMGIDNVILLIIASFSIPLAIGAMMQMHHRTRRIFLGKSI